MSADKLLAAARVIRERAEAADILADREPWAIWRDLTTGGYTYIGNAGGVIPDDALAVDGEHNLVAKAYTPELAEHIILWSPPVALAIAEWLEQTALVMAKYQDRTIRKRALAVADVILGDKQ